MPPTRAVIWYPHSRSVVPRDVAMVMESRYVVPRSLISAPRM